MTPIRTFFIPDVLYSTEDARWIWIPDPEQDSPDAQQDEGWM